AVADFLQSDPNVGRRIASLEALAKAITQHLGGVGSALLADARGGLLAIQTCRTGKRQTKFGRGSAGPGRGCNTVADLTRGLAVGLVELLVDNGTRPERAAAIVAHEVSRLTGFEGTAPDAVKKWRQRSGRRAGPGADDMRERVLGWWAANGS